MCLISTFLPLGPSVQNIEAIKWNGSPISIWKPALGTVPAHVVDKSGDETWLWKDGRVNKLKQKIGQKFQTLMI